MMDKLWGAYEVLLDESNCKVKKLIIYPKMRISYHSHKRRSEMWVVISGKGKFTLNNEERGISPGDILSIPAESKHRVENTSDLEPFVAIETMRGSYFGEDDLIRYDDDWGRHRDNWNDVDDDTR